MAVETRVHAPLVFDLACRTDNCVAQNGYMHDLGVNALQQDWAGDIRAVQGQYHGWAWLNPPFDDIEPWVQKACEESAKGLGLLMLVPASVGANWWRDYVQRYAYALHLNPRVTFVGALAPYPKDCSVLIYSPLRLIGSETWTWRS